MCTPNNNILSIDSLLVGVVVQSGVVESSIPTRSHRQLVLVGKLGRHCCYRLVVGVHTGTSVSKIAHVALLHLGPLPYWLA